jgi:3-oxoacyl-[acyl-carrier-protein] synthase III
VTSLRRARIVSVGTAVPSRVLTNKDLEKIIDTSDEWITARTGIRQRYVVGKDESVHVYDLGALAARQALNRAAIDPKTVDAVLCATFSPDNFFPATACRIQHEIGCTNAFAFDLLAACAGFVYALTIANSLIQSGQCSTVVVVGAEIATKTLDWNDRSTCILFGDGAGAVVLTASSDDTKGILSTYLHSDGSQGDILRLPAWGDKRYMKMNGAEVYKNAVRLMSDAVNKALAAAGLDTSSVDLLIPHQANLRIIQAIGHHMKLPKEKIVVNIDRYSNTGSASIPLALDDAWQNGQITDGSLTVFTALGGGLASGGVVVRW